MIYLFFLLITFTVLLIVSYDIGSVSSLLIGFEHIIRCILIGGIGGVLYCIRGVYLNYSVRNQWDDKWRPWYYIRPVASLIMGGISYVFLKAGLILLDASAAEASSDFGFLAVSFIAGLNVDNFVKKIEDIAQSSFGIKKSKTSEEE